MALFWTLISLFSKFLSFCTFVAFHGWVLALLVAVIISVVFSVRYRRSKRYDFELSQVQIELIKSEALKLLPVDPANEWVLEAMYNGLRIFGRHFTVLPNSCSKRVFACSILVDSSPKQALHTSLSTSGISSWFGYIRGQVKSSNRPSYSLAKLPSSGDSDTITFSMSKPMSTVSKIFINFLDYLTQKEIVSKLSEENLKRNWHQDGRQYHLVHYPSHPSSIPYQWSMFIYSAVPHQKDITLVTAITSPMSDVELSQRLVSFQLCSLRDHLLMREVFKTADGGRQQTIETDKDALPIVTATGDETITKSEDLPSATSSGLLSIDVQYVDIGQKCAQDLLHVTNATENDGWTTVSSSKSIHIMKKDKGQSPVNCVKGTMKINAPPDFVLRVLMDPTHNRTLDDMLKDLTIIKEITPTIQLVHLTYKAVWPTSSRDFSVCNVVGRIDRHTRVHAACSVVDSRIPEVRGCVRGDVIAGGYCIKDCPGDPNSSEVTYITQVDLKGNVPAFVVNKLVESQPQCVNTLSNIVIKEFTRLSSDPSKLKEFEDKYPIYEIYERKEQTVNITLEPSNPQQHEAAAVIAPIPELPPPQLITAAEINPSGIDNDNTYTAINGTLMDNTTDTEGRPDDLFDDSNIPIVPMSSVLDKLPRYRNEDSLTHDQISLSRQSLLSGDSIIEYPRNDGVLDYRTRSNQIAARVLEEIFSISGLDIMDPLTYKDQPGGWKFQGIEKDVAILKKKMPESPFQCFIGRGIIHLPPQEVFNCVRNPTQRFTYDNMLKELHVVKQIEEGIYVLHLHHEATQCFLRQSRDFCLLVCERSEPNKKLVVGSSVDIPECPPQAGITRGRIINSGWVIEPYRRDKKLCTQVTYTAQIDMAGVPANIVNFITRRQPLAVAYIRDFLEQTSLNFKEHLSEKMPQSLTQSKESPITPVRFKI